MSYYSPVSNPLPTSKQAPLVPRWIFQNRPLPDFQSFADELILAVAYWCLDPVGLLSLSSTCKKFADILRKSDVWLSHHWGRGYDIGVLAKKAKHAAAAPRQTYGPDGWGVLVKSAFDKAEFPDDRQETQWEMGKPLPHYYTQEQKDPDAIQKYQPRGERWMRVLYDILTEHEQYNLELYRYLHDEALLIRVKHKKYRYLQALISASELLIRMWAEPIAAIVSQNSRGFAQESMKELPPHDYRYPSFPSLTYTFLVALKIMQIDPDAQTQRRLYPHPPFGPTVWEGPEGEIDPQGLGWTSKVMNDWKGRVYCVGQHAKIVNCPSPYTPLQLGPAPMRMCLDFTSDGQITGRGGDFGGKFLISGSYRKTFVEMTKRYDDDDDDEEDIYFAMGHMTPWGIYGHWGKPDEPQKIIGYFVLWIFEGAPAVPLGVPAPLLDGRMVLSKHHPYVIVRDWFEEYERQRDAGEFRERLHGYWDDPNPPQPEDIPLPEMDAYGL